MDAKTTENAYERLLLVLPTLVGQRVVDAHGVEHVVESHVGRFFKAKSLSSASGSATAPVRRMSVPEAVKGWVKKERSMHKSKVGLSADLKLLIHDLLTLSKETKTEFSTIQKRLRTEKSVMRDLKEKMAKHKKLERRRGNMLKECQDNHTGKSLEKKLQSCEGRIDALVIDHEVLRKEMKSVFIGQEGIINFFFNEFGIKLKKSTLTKYSKLEVFKCSKPGRPTALGELGEKFLALTVVNLDRMGFPMSRSRIIGVAQEMLREGQDIGNANRELSVSWYKSWLKRMIAIYPQLREVSCRTTDTHCLDWFNEEHYTWWVRHFLKTVVDEGFVKLKDGKYTWVTPDRVMFTDETCISGGQLRKKQEGRLKVLTVEDSVEGGSGGTGQRRLPSAETYQEHITMMAGYTLDYELIPPWYIISSSAQRPKEQTLEEIRKAAIKYPEFPKVNGYKLKEPIIGWSKKGGVTRDNIKDMAIKMIRDVWPDVEDKDGKRVLWLTDMHGSRLYSALLDELKQMGVVLCVWLPNCTSKMQPPDVAMFGPFKEARDKLEREWVARHPSQKITRADKIKFAGDALVKACHHTVLVAGARRTGILPLDPNILLNHPSMQDGSFRRENHKKVAGTKLKFELQDYDPILSLAEVAEAGVARMAKKRPMIGPNRLLFDGLASEEEHTEMLKDAKRLSTELLLVFKNLDQDVVRYKVSIESKKAAIESQIDELQKTLKVLDTDLETYKLKRKQEEVHLDKWGTILPSLGPGCSEPKQKLLSVVLEKLQLLSIANADEFHLPTVEASSAESAFLPATPVAGNVSIGPLKRTIEHYASSARERSWKRLKSKRDNAEVKYNFDGSGILNGCSDINLTGEAIRNRVREHEAVMYKKQQQRQANKSLREKKSAHKLVTLKENMIKAGDLVKAALQTPDPVTSLRLNNSRSLITLGIEYAKLNDESELLHDLNSAAGKKRNELKQSILDVYRKHSDGALGFLNDSS